MWSNPLEPADLVTFTEESLNGKLHFCAVNNVKIYSNLWSSECSAIMVANVETVLAFAAIAFAVKTNSSFD